MPGRLRGRRPGRQALQRPLRRPEAARAHRARAGGRAGGAGLRRAALRHRRDDPARADQAPQASEGGARADRADGQPPRPRGERPLHPCGLVRRREGPFGRDRRDAQGPARRDVPGGDVSLLAEVLAPSFLLHHAVYGSLAVGFVCPLVGVYIILRRMVFWGVALPQVSAAGIAAALMLQGLGYAWLSGGEAGERHLAIVGAVLFTGAAILALAWLERRGGSVGDGRLGALYAAAGAATILCVAWNAAGETEMMGLLKGEIVSISESDFHAMINAFAAIAAGLFLFQKELLLVSFDRDMAVTLGRSVVVWDALLYLMVGLTVSLGVMTVGPLVIFGLLVLPPMAALPWARSMGALSVLASLAGGLSALGGFLLSYSYDLPLGPVIVGAATAAWAASAALRALVDLRNGGRAAP
ncbi:metal ABC transporter permease [bacterium]|nr:MAG: metal ABC transporter permease [bacterium]